MRWITVAGAVLNQTPLDWDNNAANIASVIDQARRLGVGVLCLPEMCLSGYGCEDAFASPDLRRTARKILRELLPRTKGMVVSFGLPVLYRNGLFNGVPVAADGKLVGIVAKRHLAGEGLHYEPRWFKPWPSGVRAEVDLDGEMLPIGDIWFEFGAGSGGVKIGFEICEDAWVAERPGARLASRGVDLLLNPSASHFAFGKIAVRERFVLEGSRAFGAAYVYSNLLGNEAGRAIYDGGVLIASGGEMLARGARFSYRPWGVTACAIDLDRQRTAQARTASFQPDVTDDPTCVRVQFVVPEGKGSPAHVPTREGWETSSAIKEEEFTRAVSLGLFDYMRKSRSRGFVVSLSGGADSAAVVSLIRTMVGLSVGELGVEAVRERLSYAKLKGRSPEELVGELLTTAYQATANSSDATRKSARSLAAAIGARHHEFEIGSIVDSYERLGEAALGRTLTWERDDIALQNIQARVRAPGVWLLANVLGALLLTTSNRSEAAVGYATMDGDTCGGLAPLAGIDKAFLLQWLRWLQREGPAGAGGGPIAALSVVNALRPTPELRPAGMGQTTEGDLLPFEILEAMEDAAIGAKQSPREVFAMLAGRWPEAPAAARLGWVEKFFTLWCRNQWKRERYAPSFHLDDHNLDPKTWCRFPILSGGYVRELAELRREVLGGGTEERA